MSAPGGPHDPATGPTPVPTETVPPHHLSVDAIVDEIAREAQLASWRGVDMGALRTITGRVLCRHMRRIPPPVMPPAEYEWARLVGGIESAAVEGDRARGTALFERLVACLEAMRVAAFRAGQGLPAAEPEGW
ncbi:MAG: hypothetical protein IT355_12100 [Gemmatimonadaceae bacterium]|nr:hypothetical protein [Gemmatimonadaceae bacterium]